MIHASTQTYRPLIASFAAILIGLAAGISAAAPVNFTDDVGLLLKRHCGKCHGEAVHKHGLDFSNYEAALKGGSGGPVFTAGRPTRSRMLDLVTSDEPAERMPLGGEPLTPAEVGLLKTWIIEGLRKTATSETLLPDVVEFASSAAGRNLASFDPARLPEVARPKLLRPFPILALVSGPNNTSVTAASFETIDILDVATKSRLGSLSFADGEPHVLRWNADRSKLLAAGGHPVENGAAVLYETATGKVLQKIGNEADVVLAADLSPDERLVAIGGPDRTVQIFAIADGKRTHRLVKHTDWVTALAFHPQGKWLASGDRVGNIYLWDPETGQITLSLSDHKGSIRKLAWRSDGKVLASCGEDGLIVWWDAEKGAPMTSQADSHTRQRAPGEYGKIAGGVLDAEFGPRGELVTCGRDGAVRLWNPAGQLLKSFVLPEAAKAPTVQARIVPLRVLIADDGRTIVAGDSAGRLHTWTAAAP